MTTAVQTYDPAPFSARIPALTARLEQLYEATRRAKRRLQNVKTADQHVNFYIHTRIELIKKSLEIGVSPQSIAEAIAQEMGDNPIDLKKIVTAVKRATRPQADPSAPRKRIGRPPKSTASATTEAVANDNDPVIPATTLVETPSTAATTAAVISASEATTTTASTAKSRAASRTAAPAKPATQSDNSTPSSGPKDTPEREQRMRRRTPIWVADYADDKQYAPIVARNEDEPDTDFYWRMWHTPPPWSGDMPRHADQLTETQWIEKSWSLKSPEERAAHQASLLSTAR
jgi:hypothetical protein